MLTCCCPHLPPPPPPGPLPSLSTLTPTVMSNNGYYTAGRRSRGLRPRYLSSLGPVCSRTYWRGLMKRYNRKYHYQGECAQGGGGGVGGGERGGRAGEGRDVAQGQPGAERIRWLCWVAGGRVKGATKSQGGDVVRQTAHSLGAGAQGAGGRMVHMQGDVRVVSGMYLR